MIDALHKRDVRCVLWMTNVINTPDSLADAPGDDEDLYTFGKEHGYFVNGGTPVKWWKGSGAMIDYTNPEAVAWWHRLLDRTLALGVDGWKMDGSAELFLLTRRQTVRGTLTPRDYLDLYYRDTLHYCRAWRPDFVTMVRSVDIANSRGNDQPHAPFDAAPLTWTGDQRHSWTDKGLEEAIRSGFRALKRGYPSVSSDSGGYQSAPKPAVGMPRLVYLRGRSGTRLRRFSSSAGTTSTGRGSSIPSSSRSSAATCGCTTSSCRSSTPSTSKPACAKASSCTPARASTNSCSATPCSSA